MVSESSFRSLATRNELPTKSSTPSGTLVKVLDISFSCPDQGESNLPPNEEEAFCSAPAVDLSDIAANGKLLSGSSKRTYLFLGRCVILLAALLEAELGRLGRSPNLDVEERPGPILSEEWIDGLQYESFPARHGWEIFASSLSVPWKSRTS